MSNGARRKSFKTPEPDHEPGPTFDLDGQEFRCVPVPPPAVLAAMLNSIQYGSTGGSEFRIAGLVSFLTGVVTDQVWARDDVDPDGEGGQPGWHQEDVDDLSRWIELCRDRSLQVPIEVLGEIASWLAEVYLDRPTVAPLH